MIHEANIDSPTFERVGREELRAVVRPATVDYQSGDHLHLFRLDRWGSNRATHYQERNPDGTFLRGYVDDDPIRAVITHVLPGTRLPELREDHVLLSLNVQEAP